MTERKPPGIGFGTWVERQIREAAERGEFDNLPGAGKPIADLDKPHDELWWVKDKLRREHLSYLPPTIASDTFTRADATTLGTSSTGHQWLRDGRSGWGVRSGMARVK